MIRAVHPTFLMKGPQMCEDPREDPQQGFIQIAVEDITQAAAEQYDDAMQQNLPADARRHVATILQGSIAMSMYRIARATEETE
jgi:hypothetical protein